jgi:chromosome segregation ATPase
MVGEMKKLLIIETDKKEQMEFRVDEMEKEMEVLKEEMERIQKENEINKALLQDKQEFNTQGGQSSANIQAEVEKLISENAELKKTLSSVQESEAAMKKERERLVANATNMSIMLADSRAKVDFLQMQIEEYQAGPLTNSQHGMKSQSEHGVAANQSRGFRGILSGSSASSHGTTDSGALGGNSEKSGELGIGGSQRGARNARFRSFLQNRMTGTQS